MHGVCPALSIGHCAHGACVRMVSLRVRGPAEAVQGWPLQCAPGVQDVVLKTIDHYWQDVSVGRTGCV